MTGTNEAGVRPDSARPNPLTQLAAPGQEKA